MSILVVLLVDLQIYVPSEAPAVSLSHLCDLRLNRHFRPAQVCSILLFSNCFHTSRPRYAESDNYFNQYFRVNEIQNDLSQK